MKLPNLLIIATASLATLACDRRPPPHEEYQQEFIPPQAPYDACEKVEVNQPCSFADIEGNKIEGICSPPPPDLAGMALSCRPTFMP
jgi:hypothetical protein